MILGPGTVINIDKLLSEVTRYQILDEFDNHKSRLVIDENAIIIRKEDIDFEQNIKKEAEIGMFRLEKVGLDS